MTYNPNDLIANFLRKATTEQINTIAREALKSIGKKNLLEDYDEQIDKIKLDLYRDLLIRYYSGQYSASGWYSTIFFALDTAGVEEELAYALAGVRDRFSTPK